MISEFKDEYFAGVEALWQEAFPYDPPWNQASVAIPEKMRFQPGLVLVALEGPLVVGSVMAGYEGHRGWISRIAVLRAHRHKRIGQSLLSDAEMRLAALGCVKINLQVVESNSAVVRFYEGAGYEVEPRVSMSKRLSQNPQFVTRHRRFKHLKSEPQSARDRPHPDRHARASFARQDPARSAVPPGRGRTGS